MVSGSHARAGERAEMVRTQLQERGILDPRVLEAMAAVPRHEFVPEHLQAGAYEDAPIPIGCGQTISQPYMVARMLELAGLRGGERVLEIGAGSGYQTALLSLLARETCALELERSLWEGAVERLERLGYSGIDLRLGSGWDPWPGGGSFDVILVACAPESVPAVLVDQLGEGGRLIIPVGRRGSVQDLRCLRKDPDAGLIELALDLVRFVPMR